MRLAVDQRRLEVHRRVSPSDRPRSQLRPQALLDAAGCTAWARRRRRPSTRTRTPRRAAAARTRRGTTAYWPCPPDCLTCRPVTRAGLAIVSRMATCTGSVSTSAPPARAAGEHARRRAPRPCTTARSGGSPGCGPAAGSGPRRRVFASVLTSASSSPRVCAVIATGSSGSGRSQHSSSSGSSDADTVSPVSALPSLVSAQMSPAPHASTGLQRGAHRRVDVREALVVVVPAVVRRRSLGRDERVVAADVHGGVGAQRAGEHPHERHPAHVGVGRGAHDLRGQRPFEVGR